MTARFLQSTHELKTLVLSYHPLIAIQTPEEERLQALLRAVSLDLLIPHWEWSITRGLINSADRSTIDKTKAPKLLLKHLEGITASTVVQLMDFTKHLSDPMIIRQFREVAQHFSRIRATLVLSGDPLELPPELQHLAVRFDLNLPGREELAEMVKHLITSLGGNKRIPVELTAQDQERLVLALSGLTLLQARQMVAYVALDDNKLTAGDIRTVIGRKAQAIRDSGVLDYVPPEENSYQLGGFANLKNWLQRAQIGFGAEAKAMNLRPPRGILIIGVQGCGKSLAAKAIAREWQLPLLKLDAAKLYDKFVGESERNFRRAIALAETMAPAVLWIDEIEKGLSSAGHSEADGGLSMRLFGSFLTWLQEHSQQVFVVATANDLSALPPELLRKGRFDEIFFVDLPDAGERRDIFLIHLGLRHQDNRQFDLDALVAASAGFSGAEIEQAVISGLYTSLQAHWPLSTESLVKELTSTIPLSVSRKEDVERLREHARGRFVRVH